jgi:hypothetical protein
MQIDTFPVIHVLVSGGTDWVALVATISGGIVGLTGVIASIWTVRRTINADDTRTDKADKRRIYSAFHASLDDVFVAGLRRDLSPVGKVELNNALTAMYKATSELRIIAPPSIGELANSVAQKSANNVVMASATSRDMDPENEIYRQRQELYTSMRADLGVEEGSSDLVRTSDTGENE